MRNWIASIFCILFVFSSASLFAYGTEKDHEALRTLMQKCTTAMNEGEFDQVKPYLDEHFSLITLDNSKFSSLSEFKDYWHKTFKGDKAILTKMAIKPTADDKTIFLSDNAGVVDGTAEETYYFTDGDVRSMQTRWTAVVHKVDNQWKLMSIHFSGSILDNPVLDAVKAQMMKVALIGAAAGLLLGFILMRLFRSKK